MKGIFGFQRLVRMNDPAQILNSMAGPLIDRPSDIASSYFTDRVGLGSVRLSSPSTFAQPFWNSDHSIGLVMAGEIFGYEEQKNALKQLGYAIQEGNAGQFILALYQEQGENFVCELNGSFAIALWDGPRQKLILANDRLGYLPLYYAQTPGRFSFATRSRCLLVDPQLPRKVNLLAMGQMLTYDHVLGEENLFEDIKLLPPGSVLTLSGGVASIQRYWQVDFPEYHTFRSESDYKEEFTFLLRQAVRRQQPEHPAGIMLSGGLDSRVVLAFLCEMGLQVPFRAITFGAPDADDVAYASELARARQVEHNYYSLDSDYLIRSAEQGIQITDGIQNVVHMHTLNKLTEQVERSHIIYKGFLGDALAGYFSFRDFISKYQPDETLKLFFDRYFFNFSLAEHAQLFTQRVQANLQDSILQSLRDELVPDGQQRLAAESYFIFDLYQRQRRLTLNGIQLVRSQAVVRFPFYDNDLVDFVINLPQGYRLDRYLIIQTFIDNFPDLAKIPYTGTGYPLAQGLRSSLMRFDEQIRWHLRSAGLKQVPVRQKHHYANYNDWFRGKLRPWVEDLLLSERFLSRGYYNAEYIRRLVEEQMAGSRHAQKLGSLMAIELWHQNFID